MIKTLMAQNIKHEKDKIVELLDKNPGGLALSQIAAKLIFSIHNKTLQRRLATLVDSGVITKSGNRRTARYYSVHLLAQQNKGQEEYDTEEVFTRKSKNILGFLDLPFHSREKVSYKREFIEEYVPNETAYVPKLIQGLLLEKGKRFDQVLAAGTYARQICERLLTDLSYNSSRLEGNTYSRLDTQKLIEAGSGVEGKAREETVMIMNHKEAILFLVENAQEIAPNHFTIRNLHYLLSQDLLSNPEAYGNIRTIEVNIGKSAYKPISNPHVLKELFELILLKAGKIENPFEQSFFLLVHLSYLQAFEDVNKRTSRLSCNIPFIKQNLCPLSFIDVSRDDYTVALLAIYEKNEIIPMLDLFYWAYVRSCSQYDVLKESQGAIDPFRIEYRHERKEAMGLVVRNGFHGEEARKCIEKFCNQRLISQAEKFTAMTLADLGTLHTGAIIGLGVSEAQLKAWLETRPY